MTTFWQMYKLRRFRRGIEVARYGGQPRFDFVVTPFSRAYWRERFIIGMMGVMLERDERRKYQGLILSGMMGFATTNTKAEVLKIESKARRAATAFLRAKKVDKAEGGE